jgi:hypothetical protein
MLASAAVVLIILTAATAYYYWPAREDIRLSCAMTRINNDGTKDQFEQKLRIGGDDLLSGLDAAGGYAYRVVEWSPGRIDFADEADSQHNTGYIGRHTGDLAVVVRQDCPAG